MKGDGGVAELVQTDAGEKQDQECGLQRRGPDIDLGAGVPEEKEQQEAEAQVDPDRDS